MDFIDIALLIFYITRLRLVHYRFSLSRKLYSGLAAIQYLYSIMSTIISIHEGLRYVSYPDYNTTVYHTTLHEHT